MQETVQKIQKASQTWAQLISRIYEVDPLICSSCGKKIKIITFVTHPEHIRRILSGIGWPITIPEFDPPYEPANDICQLILGTQDGFSEPAVQLFYDAGPDPPLITEIDPPHWEDTSDPPHWED